MEHTIKAFDSAYPGSMFEKPHGSYVERDDAKSLAAALLEIIATEKRSASDLLDALQESRDEFHALKAQRDELLAGLERISEKCPTYTGDFAPGESMSLSDFGGNGDDLTYESALRSTGEIGDIARALIAKHKGASHG